MKVTRVIYDRRKSNRSDLLVTCSVVLDDCLKLNDIKLCKDVKNDSCYLVLPSRVSVCREVSKLNSDKNIVLPEDCIQNKSDNKDEYFHPVDVRFYCLLLNTILEGYERFKGTGDAIYRPLNYTRFRRNNG